MTREEAINNLNMISVAFVEAETKEQRKIIDDTFEMAIKAIKMKDKIEAALLEILEDVEPKCINDSSDKYGSISHYQRGLYDAAKIILKHVGEDLKQ